MLDVEAQYGAGVGHGVKLVKQDWNCDMVVREWEVRKKKVTHVRPYTWSHTFRLHIVLFSAQILF